jgi:alpha-mannosidase
LAFAVPTHDGPFGKELRLFSIDSEQVALQAVKRSEDGKSIVLRLQELMGREARSRLRAVNAITEAMEMTGVENVIAPLPIEQGTLRLDFLPNQIRTVGVGLRSSSHIIAPHYEPLLLDYDLDVMSGNDARSDGNCDGSGATYPTEMLTDRVQVAGVAYQLGPREKGKKNALSAKGQVLALPSGYSRVFILAASVIEQTRAVFTIGNLAVPVNIGNWTGFLGQWDRRVFAGSVPEYSYSINNDLVGIAPGYLNTDRVAWTASHQHHATDGDLPYRYSYLYSYDFAIPSHATTLTLPKNPQLRIFAITVAKDDNVGVEALNPPWPDVSRDATFRARFDSP